MDKYTHSSADQLRKEIYALRSEIYEVDLTQETSPEDIEKSMLVIMTTGGDQRILPTDRISTTMDTILASLKIALETELSAKEAEYIDLYGPLPIGEAAIEESLIVSSNDI